MGRIIPDARIFSQTVTDQLPDRFVQLSKGNEIAQAESILGMLGKGYQLTSGIANTIASASDNAGKKKQPDHDEPWTEDEGTTAPVEQPTAPTPQPSDAPAAKEQAAKAMVDAGVPTTQMAGSDVSPVEKAARAQAEAEKPLADRLPPQKDEWLGDEDAPEKLAALAQTGRAPKSEPEMLPAPARMDDEATGAEAEVAVPAEKKGRLEVLSDSLDSLVNRFLPDEAGKDAPSAYVPPKNLAGRSVQEAAAMAYQVGLSGGGMKHLTRLIRAAPSYRGSGSSGWQDSVSGGPASRAAEAINKAYLVGQANSTKVKTTDRSLAIQRLTDSVGTLDEIEAGKAAAKAGLDLARAEDISAQTDVEKRLKEEKINSEKGKQWHWIDKMAYLREALGAKQTTASKKQNQKYFDDKRKGVADVFRRTAQAGRSMLRASIEAEQNLQGEIAGLTSGPWASVLRYLDTKDPAHKAASDRAKNEIADSLQLTPSQISNMAVERKLKADAARERIRREKASRGSAVTQIKTYDELYLAALASKETKQLSKLLHRAELKPPMWQPGSVMTPAPIDEPPIEVINLEDEEDAGADDGAPYTR